MDTTNGESMVMDVTPSPQCVGREFVRQYYTLLNEGPQFLHRFYSHNSSYAHGGNSADPPVIGQAEIHKKIMSLKFNDCHAKIRYVDTQATLSTGVVIQVTGELSNNQEPLRRFMQTFVLAPQTPNKYYVHNDIFRYQDEVFNDSDEEEELAEPNLAMSNQQTPSKQPETPETMNHPVMEGDPQMNSMDFYPQQMQAAVEQQQLNNGVSSGVSSVSLPAQERETVTPEPTLTNGHQEETTSQVSTTPPSPAVETEVIDSPELSKPIAAVEPETSSAHVPPASVDTPKEPPQQANAEPVATEEKPLSWANVLYPGTANTAGTAATPAMPSNNTFQSPPNSDRNSSSSSAEKQPMPQPNPRAQAMRGNRPGGGMSMDSKAFGSQPGTRPVRGDEGSGGEERKLDRHKYPDSQQVFVGNLPNGISEFELRDFFRDHGVVLEVRINRNSLTKLPFGFVVFDDETCAQKVLANKSLDFHGQRLNIEEKKARNDNRTHSNSRSGGGRRGDGQRHMRGGNRRGMGGGMDGDNRNEQGRFNNLNKSSQQRR